MPDMPKVSVVLDSIRPYEKKLHVTLECKFDIDGNYRTTTCDINVPVDASAGADHAIAEACEVVAHIGNRLYQEAQKLASEYRGK